MKRSVIIKLSLLYLKQLPLSQADITHSLQSRTLVTFFFNVILANAVDKRE